VQGDGVAPGVAAEHHGRARVGAQQAEQQADRGGLARAVGAEEAVHLPGGNLEVEAVERPGRAEGLRQAGGRDRGRGHDPDAT
jgi:hypothetical protein